MADDATKLGLVARFSTCPELFDFKIICNGREFPVHRFVLSLHSEVFKRACVSQFIESSRRAIDTSEDHETDEIRASIEYMYNFDYSEPSDLEEAVQFHVRMAVLADKWNVRGLRELATKKFTNMLAPHWSVLVPAIKVAYTAQPLIAEMCQAVVKKAVESQDTLLAEPSNGNFDDVMLAHPQFAVDLVHHQARTKPVNTRLHVQNCSRCGTVSQARNAPDERTICHQCTVCARVWCVIV